MAKQPQRLGQTQPFDRVRRKAEANKRKGEYALPTRIKLIRWAPSELINEDETVPPGTRGWTGSVDDIGTVWVEWDNGATLGVTTEDEIEVIPVCDTCRGTGTDYVGNVVPAPITCKTCGGSGRAQEETE